MAQDVANPPQYADMADEQLIQHHLSGDEAAFQTLVERYQTELFHFLMRFIGSKSAADDLFQETFLQVHLSAQTFDQSKRFKPWLFTIAANKARDQLRKNKRRRTTSLSGSPINDGSGRDLSFVDLLEADVPQPSESVSEEENGQIIRAVVDDMPEHLREVLMMSYFNKMAYKDIAEQLEIPLGTVKSRLHSAIATFADLYKAKTHPNASLKA